MHFVREKISYEVQQGAKLSECIRAAGLVLETPCNCVGSCGKCKVKAWGELYPPDDFEKEFINGSNIRLACQARVKGEVWIELAENNKDIKTLNKGFSIDVELDNTFQLVLSEPREILGVAIDIGTTGISAYLIDLLTGEILNKVSSLNPQTQYGGDVLTRISFCIENPAGATLLRDAIIEKINQLVINLCGHAERAGVVYHIVIAGNTTMQHLVLGVNPGSIARAPYSPVFLNQVDMKAIEAGIHINIEGRLTLLPSPSAFVGADILAGVVAAAFDKKQYPALFLDIGTNGEIVANLEGKLIATSTAAGPALEGMNISWGCRAEEGAIDTFYIDSDFNIHYTTIGHIHPKGICGSGLIDITAALIQKKIVLVSGRFNINLDPSLKSRLRDKKFYLTEEIYISQTDIRQIQLAKGAIATGVTMLLEEAGVSIEAIEEAVVAGAFGYHINPVSMLEMGLLPKGFKGKITFVGNSSVEGAHLALINKGIMKRINELKNSIKVVELSTKPGFQDCFIKALSFSAD